MLRQVVPDFVSQASADEPHCPVVDPTYCTRLVQGQQPTLRQHSTQPLHQALDQWNHLGCGKPCSWTRSQITLHRRSVGLPDDVGQKRLRCILTAEVLEQLAEQLRLIAQPLDGVLRHKSLRQDGWQTLVQLILALVLWGELHPVILPHLHGPCQSGPWLAKPRIVRENGNAKICDRLAHVVQQRADEDHVGAAMFQPLAILCAYPARQLKPSPERQRRIGNLQHVDPQATRLSVVMALARGQHLHELGQQPKHRQAIRVVRLLRKARAPLDGVEQRAGARRGHDLLE